MASARYWRLVLASASIVRLVDRQLTGGSYADGADADRNPDPYAHPAIGAHTDADPSASPDGCRNPEIDRAASTQGRRKQQQQRGSSLHDATLGDKRSEAGIWDGSSISMAIWVHTVRHRVTARWLWMR